MEAFVRLLLRFLLVPLGYVIAVAAGSLVILFGSWKLGQAAADANAHAYAIFGFLFAASVLLAMLLGVMWLPATVGILISEAFAIRSWVFHAANGAVSAWVGWHLFGGVDDTPLNEPLSIIAAGLAGGLAYWAIAGSSAGFGQPVFGRAKATALPPASPPPQIR